MKKYINPEHKLFPVVILVLLSIIWGSSFILMKRGLDAFSPLQVGTLRIVFAFIVLLPFAVKHIKPVFLQNWKKFLLIGMIGNFIPAILFPIAESGLSSSIAGILNALTPIFTLIIGVLFFTTKLNHKQITGLVIGFLGTIGITFVNSEGEIGSFNYFAVFVIIATIFYGTSGNLVKKLFANVPASVLTALSFLAITPFAVVYLLTSDIIFVIKTNPQAISSLIYIFILGVMGTAFALLFFYKLIQNTTAVFASTVTYLIPIIAVFWGVLDGESIQLLHFAGMGMIILGVFIVNRNK